MFEIFSQTARNQLKAALLMELESPRNFFLDLGLQAIITGQVLTSDELAAAIDKITTTDVQNVSLTQQLLCGVSFTLHHYV